jgi:hypothetical protein
MNIETLKRILDTLELCNGASTVEGINIYTDEDIGHLRKVIQEEALRNVQRIGQEIEQDWSTQEAALESLREHMARIKELEAQLELMKSEEPVGEVSDHDWSTGLLYRDLEPGTPLYTHPQIGQEMEQEPVAYIRVSKTGNVMACAKTDDFYALPNGTLLYTHPQPKHEHVY